jgi:S-adenosyl methyltransferase
LSAGLPGTRGAAWCPGLALIVIFPRAGARVMLAAAMSGDGKDAMEPGFAASEIDTSKPHPARMYDAYLGGKDNYAADREAVGQILRTWPEVRDMARANRAFMQRAVRFLAGEAGVRQFVDIGTGIPSAGNVHRWPGRWRRVPGSSTSTMTIASRVVHTLRRFFAEPRSDSRPGLVSGGRGARSLARCRAAACPPAVRCASVWERRHRPGVPGPVTLMIRQPARQHEPPGRLREPSGQG